VRRSPPVEFPDEQDRAHRVGCRLAWATIAYYLIDMTIMYLVVGRSQAMKAAWLQDVFAIVPPVGFLIACRVVCRRPNKRFPYGYHRAVSVAFFFAALSLIGVGLYLVVDSVIPFIHGEHPTIGVFRLFGSQVWLGWPMFAALIFSSALPPFFLGRMMFRPAKVMHDKVLYANAEMQKAGWLSAAAALVGVAGIGLGIWWLDYVAALVIAYLILKDGYTSAREAISVLMDEVPKTTDFRAVDPSAARIKTYLQGLAWVKEAAVRLREEGHVFFGDALVVPRDQRGLMGKLHKAIDGVKKLDWRIYDFSIMPVSELNDDTEARPERATV
jgi:cation diffusion facilitator family transporter